MDPFVLNHFAYEPMVSKEEFKASADRLKKLGMEMNAAKGLFQEDHGEPGEQNYYFGQYSTMAELIKVRFLDGMLVIPTQYYEITHTVVPENGVFRGFRQAEGLISSTNTIE